MSNGSASEIEGRFNPQNAENRRSLRRNAGALQNAAALIDSKIRERDKNGSHDHNENNKNDKKKRNGGKDQVIVDLLKKVKKKGSRRQLYNFRPETKKDHDAVFSNSPSYQLEFLIQQALYSQDGPGSKHRRLQNRRIIENATSASELKTVLNNSSQNDHNHSMNVINQHSIPSLVISKYLKNYAFDRLDDLRKELNQEVTMHTDNLDSMNTQIDSDSYAVAEFKADMSVISDSVMKQRKLSLDIFAYTVLANSLVIDDKIHFPGGKNIFIIPLLVQGGVPYEIVENLSSEQLSGHIDALFHHHVFTVNQSYPSFFLETSPKNIKSSSGSKSKERWPLLGADR